MARTSIRTPRFWRRAKASRQRGGIDSRGWYVSTISRSSERPASESQTARRRSGIPGRASAVALASAFTRVKPTSDWPRHPASKRRSRQERSFRAVPNGSLTADSAQKPGVFWILCTSAAARSPALGCRPVRPSAVSRQSRSPRSPTQTSPAQGGRPQRGPGQAPVSKSGSKTIFTSGAPILSRRLLRRRRFSSTSMSGTVITRTRTDRDPGRGWHSKRSNTLRGDPVVGPNRPRPRRRP